VSALCLPMCLPLCLPSHFLRTPPVYGCRICVLCENLRVRCVGLRTYPKNSLPRRLGTPFLVGTAFLRQFSGSYLFVFRNIAFSKACVHGGCRNWGLRVQFPGIGCAPLYPCCLRGKQAVFAEIRWKKHLCRASLQEFST
jgi:hypothetical protein